MRHRALVSTIVVLAIVLLASPSLLRAQEASPSAEGSSILVRPGGVIIVHDAAADQERTVVELKRLLLAPRRGYLVVTLSELDGAGLASRR